MEAKAVVREYLDRIGRGDPCFQAVLEARTSRGGDYRNYFHLAFQVRGGRIILAREHLDTQHANDAFAEGENHG